MKSILNALQEGRLIELPETDKEKALRYMATILEAIPGIDPEGIAEGVLARENSANTAIGRGWACPHIRVHGDGELFSVIGWSPAGINYGAADGEPVHLLVMFYIPETQKTSYLKELSSLAKAIQANWGMKNIEKATGINDVRNELLNWVSAALDAAKPDAKARMIRLEVKQALNEQQEEALLSGGVSKIIPLFIIASPSSKPVVLAQDKDLVSALESAGLSADISAGKQEISAAGYKVFMRSKTSFQPDRQMYDCLAVKTDQKKQN